MQTNNKKKLRDFLFASGKNDVEWILSCKLLFTFSCLPQGQKNIPLGVLLTLANHRSLSSSFLLFPVFSFRFKDPPELHSAELLTFCSSFVFVPFVSVTERERGSETVQTGRM